MLSLTSSAFENGGTIPVEYTCDGEGVNPPLEFSGVPEGTKSLALIMYDPDVPRVLNPAGTFDHWLIPAIPPETRNIPEGADDSYIPPCPPPQYEPREHRYIFKLYALRIPLAVKAGATREEVMRELAPVTLAEAELIGRYSRK